MRGYYTIINEVPYELTKMPLTQASRIVGEEKSHIEVTPQPYEKTLTVNITQANMTKDMDTNKVLAEGFGNLLRNKKITEISKLTNHFTVYVEYVLYDNICNAQVAHDVAVKDICPQSFLFPLGITEEDEYVARFGFQLQSEIIQRYRSKHPFGMNRGASGESYTLTIMRIYVTAPLERAYSLAQRKAPQPFFAGHYISHQNGMADYHSHDWGMPYGMCRPSSIGSLDHQYYHHPLCSDMSYIVKDFMLDPRDMVVIYDSFWETPEGEAASPVYSVTVKYAPETIIIDFTLKSIMLTLISQEKVAAILAENKVDIDPDTGTENPAPTPEETPATPSTPPVSNEPLVGEEKDVADKDSNIPGLKDTVEEGSGTPDVTDEI